MDEDTVAALAWIEQSDIGFYRIDKTYSEWSPANDALIQHYCSVTAYDSSPDADVEEFYEKLWEEAIVPWASWSKSYVCDSDCYQMAQVLGLKYILSHEVLYYEWLELVHTEGSVYVYQAEGVESIMTIRPNVVGESVADALEDSESRRELLESSVIVPDEVAERTDVNLSEPSMSRDSSMALYREGDSLCGNVATSADSVVCLSVPYTGTWVVTVDDEEVATFRANYGFVGFEITAGEHAVEVRYVSEGQTLGAVLSLIGLVVTLGACRFIRVFPRNNRCLQNDATILQADS